jgi:hypothetical protein
VLPSNSSLNRRSSSTDSEAGLRIASSISDVQRMCRCSRWGRRPTNRAAEDARRPISPDCQYHRIRRTKSFSTLPRLRVGRSQPPWL